MNAYQRRMLTQYTRLHMHDSAPKRYRGDRTMQAIAWWPIVCFVLGALVVWFIR